jgi:hypothetical protein
MREVAVEGLLGVYNSCSSVNESAHLCDYLLSHVARALSASFDKPFVKNLDLPIMPGRGRGLSRADPPRSIQFTAVILRLGLAHNRIAFRGAEQQGI